MLRPFPTMRRVRGETTSSTVTNTCDESRAPFARRARSGSGGRQCRGRGRIPHPSAKEGSSARIRPQQARTAPKVADAGKRGNGPEPQ
jgi:hypothetical protein